MRAVLTLSQADPRLPPVVPVTDADWADMAKQGFNVVRLLVSWSSLEPVRDVFDEAYAIPVGIDTTVHVARYDVSLLAAFPSLLGPLNQYRTRVVWLSVAGRWP